MTTKQQNNPQQPENNKKRRADESLHIEDNECETVTKTVEHHSNDSFPTFIVVEAEDHQPINMSVFAIQKFTKMAFGNIKCAKKMRNGAILIEVTNKNTS